MSTITVHDGQGKNPTVLTETQYNELKATGMLWEFHPDAPLQWPTTPDQPATVDQIAQECARRILELQRTDWKKADLDAATPIIAAAIREATEQKEGEIKRLKADNDSLRTLWTEIRTVLIQSRAANCVCSYGAQQADAVEAANAVLKRMPPDVTNENTQLRAALDEAEGALKWWQELKCESRGVAGYHMNGDVAEWDELDDPTEEALARIVAAARSGKADTSDSPTDS